MQANDGAVVSEIGCSGKGEGKLRVNLHALTLTEGAFAGTLDKLHLHRLRVKGNWEHSHQMMAGKEGCACPVL